MHLDAIHVYPIKSCGGLALAEALLDDRGLVHDRRYMLVDERDRFLTLRTEPRLSRVHLDWLEDGFEVDLGGRARFALPFELDEGPEREVVVWEDRVKAVEHPEGSRAFSSYLGTAVRLVHMPGRVERQVDPRFADPTDRVGFADAYPLLLLGKASVDDLSARVGERMAMARFRPNLVFTGGEPYAEDRFAEIRIGDLRFRGPKACSRCVATTVDPASGLVGREPLRTMASYRRANGGVWLGMNLIHDDRGVMRTGDRIEVCRFHDRPAFGG